MRISLLYRGFTVVATVLIGGFCAATFVRLAPGFGVDEREIDSRLSDESVRRIRDEAQSRRQGPLDSYIAYLAKASHGDLGFSRGFHRPVAELIAERFPQTARSAGAGLVAGWACGLILALGAASFGHPALDLAAGAGVALLLCLPSSVVALFSVVLFHSGGTGAVASVIALVIFPRVFCYARGILGRIAALPHVMQARAKGVSRVREIAAHILRPALPSALALLGISVSIAFGAAIPVEVICDSPGLGQLAWQAALKRDLPLLINITLLVTVLTGVSSLAADLDDRRSGARDPS